MVNFPVKADDSTQYDVYISGFIYNDNDYPTVTMWKNSKEIELEKGDNLATYSRSIYISKNNTIYVAGSARKPTGKFEEEWKEGKSYKRETYAPCI